MRNTSGGRARTSSVTAGLLLLTLVGAPAAAQDTSRVAARDSLAPDSLLARLQRAERAIEALREQLGTQSASGVQSASRVQVEIFGRALMNAFSNSGRVNNADVPLFVVPGSSGGVAGTIRQTSFGLSITDANVFHGRFAGELHADFFGGQQPSTGGRHFPLVRLRTAFGTVRWTRAELLFGQEVPLVLGLNPVSVAAFGTPEFVAAGNLWLWLPQIRLSTDLLQLRRGDVRIGVQAAALAPASGDAANAFDTDFDVAERSRRPFVQARLRGRWGVDERAGEIGIGVHQGWLERTDNSLVVSRAVAADARIPLGAKLELRAEAYTGEALRGLGGGGIGQNLTTTGAAVRDRGGWTQINVRPTTLLELGAGCGVGDPDDDNLPAQRLRNVACAAHLVLRPGGPLLLGVGYRRHETTYPMTKLKNDHVNLAVGFAF